MSDSPGLVDFAIGLVNSVLNLPNRHVKFFGEFKLQKNCNQFCSLHPVPLLTGSLYIPTGFVP